MAWLDYAASKSTELVGVHADLSVLALRGSDFDGCMVNTRVITDRKHGNATVTMELVLGVKRSQTEAREKSPASMRH